MNSLLRCCIVATAALGAAACASHGSPGYATTAASDPAEFTRDAEYTGAVEHLARRRGVEVHWINPPVKRTRVASADDNGVD